MRKIPISLVVLLALMAPALAMAEDAKPLPDLQTLEELPPPAISNEENADEPEITIIKKDGETIEEYRIAGQLYMMKITPANGVPYYLHKEDQDGGWVNNGPVQPMSIPKWTLFRF